MLLLDSEHSNSVGSQKVGVFTSEMDVQQVLRLKTTDLRVSQWISGVDHVSEWRR